MGVDLINTHKQVDGCTVYKFKNEEDHMLFLLKYFGVKEKIYINPNNSKLCASIS
jgi:hypothetical protein